MKKYKKYVSYENSLTPLNEGFFSWIAGLLKNLFKGIFHVNSYDEFVKRLNKMPNIILGIESKNSNEEVSTSNTDNNDSAISTPNESMYIPKRSRRRLFEARSRFAGPLTEATNKMDNLGLDRELVNNLLNYGQCLIKKENSNVSFNDEQKAKIEEIYNSKVKKDKTLETFVQKAEQDGEAGVKGFENKDYYTVLYAIKVVIESENKNTEDNNINLDDDNLIISFLDDVYNDTESEELKKQIEEFKSKVSKLENDIKLLEEEKEAVKEEGKLEIESILEEHRKIENELMEKIQELKDKNLEDQQMYEAIFNEYAAKIDELNKEIERLKEENEELKKENDKLSAELKYMKGEDYKSEFKPITYDDLKNKTKMPSFKNALITLLQALNDKTSQLNDKITDEKLEAMRKNIEANKTIAMSDIQVIELAVSDFLNLYSSGTMNLPKPEKGKGLTISDLSQYQNVVSKSDPEKKFASLYNSLNKVVDIYEENFNEEMKLIRDKEVKYQQERANNKSWNGDGDMDYKTIKKLSDNDMEVRGTIESIIDGCRGLIPNAIMGFFIASPIYKAAEEKINTMIDVLIANEKVVEENKKNPDLQVISVFSDILSNTVKEEDVEKVDEASKLFSEKVEEIVKNEQLKGLDFKGDEQLNVIIQSSGVKVIQKETLDTIMKKLQDVKSRLAFACLYFVYTKKPLKVEVDNNGQMVDLFNIVSSKNNQQQNDQNQQNGNTQNPQQSNQTSQQEESFGRRNNLRKIYDYYIWQK